MLVKCPLPRVHPEGVGVIYQVETQSLYNACNLRAKHIMWSIKGKQYVEAAAIKALIQLMQHNPRTKLSYSALTNNIHPSVNTSPV